MKYKVGDKIKFVKDCKLASGSIIKANSVWEVRHTRGEYYTLACLENNSFARIEQEFVDASCEKINTAPSITKRINEKHDILNEPNNTDAIKPNYYKYRGGDVFDMAAHFQLNFPLGNALKYLLRAGHKDPAKKVEDLQKAIQCIERAIELEG